jgi:trans-2,3-dihydro-3-hydroxyanthranilate isomerase
MSNSPLDYALVDVFAENPLEGNQLAIFTDATGLTTGQMQALARETNLAETTFILPARDPWSELLHGVRVRIFTVQEELPFAGHPTLGTAAWLYWNHPTLRGAGEITLSLDAGPIKVQFEAPSGDQPGDQPGVFGRMQQRNPIFGAVHSHEQVARVIGVELDDLDPNLPIQTVSTGLPFCIVPLRSMEAIARLCIPQAAAQAYLAGTDAKFFYCTTPAAAGSGADFHSRMQPPAAPSPGWSGMGSFPAAAPRSSSRASKFAGRRAFTCRQRSRAKMFLTCTSAGAPLRLQRDGFSSAESNLSHSVLSRNSNNYAPAQKSVDEGAVIQ